MKQIILLLSFLSVCSLAQAQLYNVGKSTTRTDVWGNTVATHTNTYGKTTGTSTNKTDAWGNLVTEQKNSNPLSSIWTY